MKKIATKLKNANLRKLGKDIWKSRQVYLLIFPVFIWHCLFVYWPMYWLRISFYDYSLYKGFEGSDFVGFQNYIELFSRNDFLRLMWNALAMNLYDLVLYFPAPIIFALFLNEMRFLKGKKVIQTISFLPHFISMVAFVAIIKEVLSPTYGLVADIFRLFGQEPIYFLGDEKYFRLIMTLSSVWQGMGWGAIVYLSALTSIDVGLYEAAMIDGANRWQRMVHVTFPGIKPTVVTLLILQIGKMLSVGYEKIYLLQNSANLGVSEVVSTYVYKRGLLKMDYTTGVTAGLFNSVLAFILVSLANRVSKKYNESAGLW